ncbi:hypothetical protein EAG_03948 [Camponotus floridanus]|uniref:Uncharacterized protein n=1 Tax=Camponotus floridanus TaxID=104421 RepID=E2A3Q1_CAMFO|nr:hypothetical protein EAG_03948 [Camponotus floridanus]
MPTKGSKHHHLSHHHHQQHHPQQQQQQPPPPPAQQQQQAHHTSSHQHQIILNQSVVHSPQTYSAVVTTNTRFLNTEANLGCGQRRVHIGIDRFTTVLQLGLVHWRNWVIT